MHCASIASSGWRYGPDQQRQLAFLFYPPSRTSFGAKLVSGFKPTARLGKGDKSVGRTSGHGKIKKRIMRKENGDRNRGEGEVDGESGRKEMEEQEWENGGEKKHEVAAQGNFIPTMN